jgi:hypothetical protein
MVGSPFRARGQPEDCRSGFERWRPASRSSPLLLTDSYPDSLSSGGKLSYILLTKHPLITVSKRFASAGGVPQEVGSPLGTPFWVDERLYIAIAGSLFQFTGDLSSGQQTSVPTIASISPAGVTAGSAGLTLTVTGNGLHTRRGSQMEWRQPPDLFHRLDPADGGDSDHRPRSNGAG